MSDKKIIPDTMLIPVVYPAGPFGAPPFLPPPVIEQLVAQNQPRLLHQATTFVRMGFELDELRVVVDVDESGSLTIEVALAKAYEEEIDIDYLGADIES